MKFPRKVPDVLLLALITLSCIITLSAYSTLKKNASWGYIYHASPLTGEYLARAVPRFDVICVSGFTIDGAGNVRSESSRMIKTITAIAALHHVTLYPMVSFQSAAQGRRILGSRRLISASARNIAAMARDGGYPGVHLDFEHLPPEDAPRLAEFLTALRKAYKGKITMAVFPPVEFPEKWNRFHDLTLIAPHVDEIVIMCYDLHGAHTGPGPVTDVRWAERNIQFALRYIDAGKLWLGIPAYGYRWCGGTARALSSREGMMIARRHSFVRDPSGTVQFTYADSGTRCSAYISDTHTRLLLQQLSLRHGLAGTAMWRLGFED